MKNEKISVKWHPVLCLMLFGCGLTKPLTNILHSNNLCEAHIRPFATAHKAWLFADTPKGAFANGVLYSQVT